MELKREHWKENDFKDLFEYENLQKGPNKDCEWEQRIVNTKLDCLGKTSAKAKVAVKEIKKGNWQEFLDNIEIKTHFQSLVFAFLLNQIKDVNLYKKYLDKFVLTIDNWASADTLKFNKIDKDTLLELSKKYIKNEKPFIRRVGVNIWFDLIRTYDCIDDAFKTLDILKNETEYYVNMCGAWLLAECMAKSRDKTVAYFENNSTNDFIINKAISKCHDSFRVSQEDKEMLKKFKKRVVK